MGFAFHGRTGVVSILAMKKLYLVNLTVEERAVLTQLVKRDRVSGLKRLRAGTS
jgi:hypothetical protein